MADSVLSRNDLINKFFEPLYGEYVWGIKNGHGSFVTMEIGAPHLEVRQPITSKAQSQRVVQALRKRRVATVGSWHFWLQHGTWTAQSESGIATNLDRDRVFVQNVLDDINGQKIQQANQSDDGNDLSILFDLGANIKISRSSETGDRWTLYGKKIYINCNEIGTIVSYDRSL